jgi:hypothetical protein
VTSSPKRELSVDEITELLTELGRRPSARGVLDGMARGRR